MKTTTKRLKILWQNTHVTFVQSEQENKRLCIEWQANVAFRVLLCYFFLVYLCVCATDQVTVHAIHAQRWSALLGVMWVPISWTLVFRCCQCIRPRWVIIIAYFGRSDTLNVQSQHFLTVLRFRFLPNHKFVVATDTTKDGFMPLPFSKHTFFLESLWVAYEVNST